MGKNLFIITIVAVAFVGCGKGSSDLKPITEAQLQSGSVGDDLPTIQEVEFNTDSVEKAMSDADVALNDFQKASVWEIADAALSNNVSKMNKVTDVFSNLTDDIEKVKTRLLTQRTLLDPNNESKIIDKIDQMLLKVDNVQNRLNNKLNGLVAKIDMLFARLNGKVIDLPWYVQLLFAEPIADIQDFLLEFKDKLLSYIKI